jgi:hypothetical protein
LAKKAKICGIGESLVPVPISLVLGGQHRNSDPARGMAYYLGFFEK